MTHTKDPGMLTLKHGRWGGAFPMCEAVSTTPPAQPEPVQEPEINGATMAGMDASIGHLSALVDELRLLLGCAMDNFKMLHNAAKSDDGPDMDAIIPAIVFAKFVNQDAALRYAIKHSAHDGMIATPPAPVTLISSEQHIALREAFAINSADLYFEANPTHDNDVGRMLFERGFARGFDSHERAIETAKKGNT